MDGRKAPRKRGNGSPIARRRIASGMTQGQLAEKIGCSQKDVSRWENGARTPRVETLAKIAGVFGCKIEDLISWEAE